MNRNKAKDEIRAQLDCRNYLKPSASGLFCCPYCNSGTGHNKTGALKHYAETNTFTCFACHTTGDVLDLIQEEEHTDFNGALEIGAAALGLELDSVYTGENSPKQPKTRSNDKLYQDTKKDAENGDKSPTEVKDYTAYYRQCADRITEPAAASYLSARGISTATAARLNMGYDAAAGIIIPTGPEQYTARSIDKAAQLRYKNTGSPRIFNSAALYAGNPVIYVTEGAFDAASLEEIGAPAIALNSSNNGKKLLQQLEERASGAKFIICFDADKDPATLERTKEAAEALKTDLEALNYESIVFDIAPYLQAAEKDINDLLQRDKSQLEALAKDARRMIEPDYFADFLNIIQTEQYRPYQTGLPFFDELLSGGIIRQTVLLLLAAPGTGKTTLCQQIAEAIATREKPIIYLNFEMSREQMLAKALSGRLADKGHSISSTAILQGYSWSLTERAAIMEAAEDYRRKVYPYLTYSTERSDLEQLKSYLHKAGEKAKETGAEAPAVILDYLHLVSSSKGLDNQELIKQAVLTLKQYAIEYNTFVIGIAATNRTSNSAGRITLESGRDSSNIEYTADYQISLNYYDIDNGTIKPDNAEGLAELQSEKHRRMILRVLKNRFGTAGKTANVYYTPAENRFRASDYIPEGAKAFTTTTGRRY